MAQNAVDYGKVFAQNAVEEIVSQVDAHQDEFDRRTPFKFVLENRAILHRSVTVHTGIDETILPLRVAVEQPDKAVLQCTDISISYAELERRIDDLSQRVHASGFSQLGLLMDNSPEPA